MVNFVELKQELSEAYRCSDHDAAIIIMDTYCYEGNRQELEQDELRRQIFQYAQRLRNEGLI